MIFKRAAAKLRAQEWTAIVIELAIVVVGVYLGAVAADWNADRGSRAASLRLLQQFKPELAAQRDANRRVRTYLDTTTAYANVALRGWAKDPAVSDSDFVIAAYQASQITGQSTNSQVWGAIFGANKVQDLSNPELRAALIRVLSIDSSLLDYRQLADAYRENVRRTIPNDVQASIRAACGDRVTQSSIVSDLPAHCPLVIPTGRAAIVAAALRARPSLAGDLGWHESGVAAYLSQQEAYTLALNRLGAAIDRSSGKAP